MSPAARPVDMVEPHPPAGRLRAADTSAGRSWRAVANIGRPRGEANATPTMKMKAAQEHREVQQKQKQTSVELAGTDRNDVQA